MIFCIYYVKIILKNMLNYRNSKVSTNRNIWFSNWLPKKKKNKKMQGSY